MITPLFASYAEIHYHLPLLYPAYFRRYPEIITDVSTRVIRPTTAGIPVALIIKDAHRYPCTVVSLLVRISGSEQQRTKLFDLNISLSQPYFAKCFFLPHGSFAAEQYLHIETEIVVRIKNRTRRFKQDSYPGLRTPFYSTYLTDSPLPFPPTWFAGDPHYHSIFTQDQVEFGADLVTTRIMAQALGLSWYFVTDHSYDLDDCIDSYTKNDPALPLWHRMQEAVGHADSAAVRIIPGEEVSIGNCKEHNVHLLAIQHQDFLPGMGDSAEEWGKNTPTTPLRDIATKHHPTNLFIAAHPAEPAPLSQKLLLKRDHWHEQDFIDGAITHGQFINCNETPDVLRGIKAWTSLLLKGHHIFLMAGNDAHGNFNFMRQIKLPFLTLFVAKKQTFGAVFTVFQHQSNDPVAGLKGGKIIVSNGPFITFELRTDHGIYPMGSTVSASVATVHYQAASMAEKGEISEIVLHVGNVETGIENATPAPPDGSSIQLPPEGYLRMALYTQKKGLAFTNPIWIKAKSTKI